MGLSQVFDDINESMLDQYMAQWAALCWHLAEEKGFHERREVVGVLRDASPGERIALIHSEASEMLDAYRDGGDPASFYFEADGKPEGAAVELADIVIRCLDYAAIYEIDLGKVMLAKLHYNATRPHRHGGKTV